MAWKLTRGPFYNFPFLRESSSNSRVHISFVSPFCAYDSSAEQTAIAALLTVDQRGLSKCLALQNLLKGEYSLLYFCLSIKLNFNFEQNNFVKIIHNCIYLWSKSFACLVHMPQWPTWDADYSMQQGYKMMLSAGNCDRGRQSSRPSFMPIKAQLLTSTEPLKQRFINFCLNAESQQLSFHSQNGETLQSRCYEQMTLTILKHQY